MLEEVLRAEMLYHCRAIEILEPLCVSMRRLDPDRAMEVRTRKRQRGGSDRSKSPWLRSEALVTHGFS